jgi:GntR family transcriptional regulator
MQPTIQLNELNRSSKVPLYHQLYELLRGAIVAGKWPPGTMVPSESELQNQLQVSQITVRQALENLVNEGLIYRQRGRGTFVSQPAIETSLSRILSFTEDMHQRGYRPGSRVIYSGVGQASPGLSEKLRIPIDSEIAQLNRLRFADDQPLSIEESALVHHYCPGVLAVDYEINSLRERLQLQYGLQITRAKQSIRALNANQEQAKLLSIEPGDALLGLERVSFSQHDFPLEFLRITYRADRYVLFTDLQG